MCLYAKLIRNPRYVSNRKNNYNPPSCTDQRKLWIWAKCGRCIECRKERQREWVLRLEQEYKHKPNAIFVTLTLNNESIKDLGKNNNPNDICTLAMRRFLERIRKERGKSVKHWAITELGEEKGRIHLHGLFWCEKSLIKKHWKYGFVYIGEYVSLKTIRYVTKYMLKQNNNDKYFVGKVLCSKGIGQIYCSTWNNKKRHRFRGSNTQTQVLLENGAKLPLPVYWKRKLFTDEQRDELFTINLDRNITYVHGEKISTSDTDERDNLIKYWRHHFESVYGEPDWSDIKERRRKRELQYRSKERRKLIKQPKQDGE